MTGRSANLMALSRRPLVRYRQRTPSMVGKRVQFDDETWNAINLLRQERRRSFQQLADEAFRDLLDKHQSPAGLKAQLRESVGKPARRARKTPASE